MASCSSVAQWKHVCWFQEHHRVAFEVFKLKNMQSEKQPLLCTFLGSLKGAPLKLGSALARQVRWYTLAPQTKSSIRNCTPHMCNNVFTYARAGLSVARHSLRCFVDTIAVGRLCLGCHYLTNGHGTVTAGDATLGLFTEEQVEGMSERIFYFNLTQNHQGKGIWKKSFGKSRNIANAQAWNPSQMQ